MVLIRWAARSLATTILTVLGLAALAIYGGTRLGLTGVGAFGLYFVIWWTLVFAILPVRIRSQAELGEITAGTDPGAPGVPALRERAIWTTVATDVAFVGAAALFPLSGL